MASKVRANKRRNKRIRVEPGTSPGEILTHPESPRPTITRISYSGSEFSEEKVSEMQPIPTGVISWLNVDGLGDAQVLKNLGEVYHLHPLALEDVTASEPQRPKLEEYPEALFIVARMPLTVDGRLSSATEQICFFLIDGAVITFQEDPHGDPFEKVRERIRHSKGKIRTRGADYLLYALLDAIIDSYFPLLEELSERIENIEELILTSPSPEALAGLHTAKQEIVTIRRSLWPLREVVNSLIRDTSDRITEETKIFLRDCYDHCSQLLEISDTYRELCADLMDIYLTTLSNRTNDVLKFLTIISTIFIPLTFIVGVYGMNFNTELSPYNMPELNWRFGYPLVMAGMAVLSIALIVFFRRRKWL